MKNHDDNLSPAGSAIAFLLVVLVAYLFLFAGCTSIPDQLPQTMNQACALYQNAKPEIVKLRDYAEANWSTIPDDIKPTLVKLDGYLPELDRAGQLICAASGVTAAARTRDLGHVDWDDVLSTVVKVAGAAADLKAKGVI